MRRRCPSRKDMKTLQYSRSKSQRSCDMKPIVGICKWYKSKRFKLQKLITSRFMDMWYTDLK